MLLKSLAIRGLYKTLSLDVSFNEDITLLVGINGSGKTSILNVIDWLLKVNLRSLAFTQYTSLALKFVENDVNYELTAKKSSKSVTLSLDGAQTR